MSELGFSLSVIVPMYNVEAFIERCACSLFDQTFQDIEFIFIDDCSKDKSLLLLEQTIEKYPDRKDYVQIIRNDSNKGVAVVRNIGLRAARGEYIGWVDSDDWIASDMYTGLFKEALYSDADIVWCDYYNTYPDREDRQYQRCNSEPLDFIKALLLGKIHGGLCFTIIKRSLFIKHSISFTEGQNVMEDKNVLIRLATYAQRISYVPEAYYHYVKYNGNSITARWEFDPAVERAAMYNLESIFVFLQNSESGIELTRYITYAKLVFKKGYLNIADMDSYARWKLLYEESNNQVMTCPNTTLKQKVLGLCISHDYYLPIKLWLKLKRSAL